MKSRLIDLLNKWRERQKYQKFAALAGQSIPEGEEETIVLTEEDIELLCRDYNVSQPDSDHCWNEDEAEQHWTITIQGLSNPVPEPGEEQ